MGVARRKRLMTMISGRDKPDRRPKRRNTNEGVCSIGDSDLTFDHNKSDLPLTPPTSVSAPPTPPLCCDLSSDFSVGGVVKKGAELELNTPCDTSGDETSSKSTLDLIIPPPKDFEGKNNPFLALLRHNDSKKGKKKKRNKEITLPLPLTAVIPGKPVMRPTKRQLSEKDIVVGPNGEVKRRRLRRNKMGGVFLGEGGQKTASKTATILPIKSNKEWGGRMLRQRPDKLQEKDKDGAAAAASVVSAATKPSPKPSPVKSEPDLINMDDLKSSVNIYFGAANRIAAGERFSVKAKRVGPNGKLEFLIEWDGNMT